MDDPPERGTVHRDFRPATKALVGALVVVSNVVGAAIVLAVAGWLLPTQSLVPDLETTLDRNLWAFGFYLAFAAVVGLTWGFLWVHVPPQPDPDAGDDVWRAHGRQARSAVLAAPLRITVVQAVPWIVAEPLFATINAFSSLTVALTEHPPHEVVTVLNAFFGEVVDVVESHRGWINKFEGDAALAVFGAPDDLDDAAGCALAAARALAERLDAGDAPATAGIAVSAGPTVAGNIGDTRRYEYTVIGDPVNEAARLCDVAKGLRGLVAASDAAIRRAGPDEAGRWTEVDVLRLRGRNRATRAHAPCDRASLEY